MEGRVHGGRAVSSGEPGEEAKMIVLAVRGFYIPKLVTHYGT